MIGCDHAWAASVLLQWNVEPSIRMRCRITASLRATATLGSGAFDGPAGSGACRAGSGRHRASSVFGRVVGTGAVGSFYLGVLAIGAPWVIARANRVFGGNREGNELRVLVRSRRSLAPFQRESEGDAPA